MRTYSSDGKPVQSGFPFELNGLAYPWNWLDLATPEDLKAHGIAVEELPDPVVIPRSITPRQARLALNAAGLLDKVEQAVAASDKSVQIAWDFATEINRDDPIIAAMKDSLGISDDALDEMFKSAVAL